VTELSGMHCIGYVCVTQRKDPEKELLCALLGASKLLIRQPPLASMSVPDRTGIGVRQLPGEVSPVLHRPGGVDPLESTTMESDRKS
jgi:hypothetical protein